MTKQDSNTLTIRIDKILKAKAIAKAKSEFRSLSSWVRWLIEQELKK